MVSSLLRASKRRRCLRSSGYYRHNRSFDCCRGVRGCSVKSRQFHFLALAAFVLAACVGNTAQAALPWFASDRFDLYRQGTNDTPLTFQYVGLVEHLHGGMVERFLAPSGQVDIFPQPSVWDSAMFDIHLYWTPFENFAVPAPDAVWVVETSEGPVDWRFSPFGLLAYNTDSGDPEVFQAEWIEPSIQHCFKHWFLGACVGLLTDVGVLLLRGLLVPIFRLILLGI